MREGLGSVPNLLCSVQFSGITMASSTYCVPCSSWGPPWRHQLTVSSAVPGDHHDVINLLYSVRFLGITMTPLTYCVPCSSRGSPWRHQSHHALRFRWAVWRAGSTRLGAESVRSARGCHRYCAGARPLPLSCWCLVPVSLPSGCSGFLLPGGRIIIRVCYNDRTPTSVTDWPSLSQSRNR